MSTGTNQALSFAAPLYPLDKVIYRPLTATAAVPKNVTPIAPVFTIVTFDNPINDYFFIDLQVSVDNNLWYDMGNEPFYYDVGFMLSFKRFASYWSMTKTTVTVGLTANDNNYVMYYRLVGVSKD